jgi:hypothetical protein
MVRPGGIRTSLPVRGLRPIPRFRGFTWKTPNPRAHLRRRVHRGAHRVETDNRLGLTLVMSAVFDASLTMSTDRLGLLTA